MRVGKTIVGQAVAQMLGMTFVDTDAVIKERTGQTIEAIFRECGEAYFRSLESDVVADLSLLDGQVISTGGGVVLNSKNMERLGRSGVIINLRARTETLMERLDEPEDRPLLDKGELEASLRARNEGRSQYYDVADHVIDTTDITAEEVVRLVVDIAMKEKRGREGAGIV